MLNTQRFLGEYVSWFISIWGLLKVPQCYITYAVGYASMLRWSLIHWGLTRSNGVSQDCFISALILINGRGDPVSQGQRSGQRFHGVLGTLPILCWCIYCPLAPLVRLFIISSLPGRLSSNSLCLWSNSRREPLMMSVVTTVTGHADFFCCSSLCVDSSPALSDCTYPGLFFCHISKHTYVLRHMHFCLSRALFMLPSVLCKIQHQSIHIQIESSLNLIFLIYHVSLQHLRLNISPHTLEKLSNAGIWKIMCFLSQNIVHGNGGLSPESNAVSQNHWCLAGPWNKTAKFVLSPLSCKRSVSLQCTRYSGK